jgi:hypothetical protein
MYLLTIVEKAGTSKRMLCRNFGRYVAVKSRHTLGRAETAFALFRQHIAALFRPTVRNPG